MERSRIRNTGECHMYGVDEIDKKRKWITKAGHTSSGVTGRWLVFLSSSITRGSRRRSFLHPTRMIGRPAQKCMTSEIH